MEKGLHKLEVNEAAIDNDLNDNWAVVAEAIQTILRREGFQNLMGAQRTDATNHEITKESIQDLSTPWISLKKSKQNSYRSVRKTTRASRVKFGLDF